MDAETLYILRRQRDEQIISDPDSPLTSEQRALFKGLNYYPHNPAVDFTVTVERCAGDDEVIIESTGSGEPQRFRRFGQFTVEIGGQQARLTLFEGDRGYFLPFRDANAGKETYGAGRYVFIEPLGENRFHIDFNLSYNPYCAYNEPLELAQKAGRPPKIWSCAITPPENRLQVAICAGEKIPLGAWVEQF